MHRTILALAAATLFLAACGEAEHVDTPTAPDEPIGEDRTLDRDTLQDETAAWSDTDASGGIDPESDTTDYAN